MLNAGNSPRERAESDDEASGERACLSDDEVLDLVEGRLQGVRSTAVHTHLDRCATCQRLVTTAARTSSEPSPSATGGWGTTFRAGDLVGGRYRIERFIARGGMGEVYEAYDGDLDERVALKTVLSTLCDSERAFKRLKAEVQLAHRVSHVNVCRIYDLGAHFFERARATMYFLTMEYVEGERLRERVERGRLHVDEALPMARQMLRGLAAAHDADILHRDFKSDNVMLRPSSGGRVSPVIMDFGLAKSLDPDSGFLTSVTNGGLAGTPCYMAPEQLEGRPLTVASDVYSFGVVLFEMLTGQLPFSPKAPFERLSRPARRVSSLVPDIPADVDGIVARCLDRAPEKRFASIDDVERAIASLSETREDPGAPTSALAVSSSNPAVSLLAERPKRLAPRTVGLVALGVGLVALILLVASRSQRPSIANTEHAAVRAAERADSREKSHHDDTPTPAPPREPQPNPVPPLPAAAVSARRHHAETSKGLQPARPIEPPTPSPADPPSNADPIDKSPAAADPAPAAASSGVPANVAAPPLSAKAPAHPPDFGFVNPFRK